MSSPKIPLVRLSNLFANEQVHAKCEFLAASGSFKDRGVAHLLGHLSRQAKTRLLVVPSMGNTALATAAVAKDFGFRMVGVVPENISRAKDEKLQALGAELIKIAGGGSDLLRTATEVAGQRDGYFVHPHLDTLWTDGYQVIAEEILQAVPECRSLVFPVGGGGLLMGLTEYLRRHASSVRLFGCEAYNYPTYARFDHQRMPTIADGLCLEVPHPKVEQRINEMSIGIHLVSDPDIRTAMADLYNRHGLVVEPSSAVTIAFVKNRLAELEQPIALVLTGANIARDDFFRLITEPG